MKITLCGSIAFIDEMNRVSSELERLGHEVKMPNAIITLEDGTEMDVKEFYTIRHTQEINNAWIWDEKEKAIMRHFDKITWGEAILVLNQDKNDIPGYIGANTLMEMGLAFFQNKPIYLWKTIPMMNYTEEIKGMKPIVIKEDIQMIRVA